MSILPVYSHILYVASPYTHVEAEIRDARFAAVCRAMVKLIADGWLAYSPIAHTIPLNQHGGAGSTWQDWSDYDLRFIRQCHAGFAILKLDGWKISVGVTAELEAARRWELPLFSIVQNDNSFVLTVGV